MVDMDDSNSKTGSSGTRKEIQHFYSHSRSANEKIIIEWKDVEFSMLTPDKVNSSLFKQVYIEKKILKGVSGNVQSGELLG